MPACFQGLVEVNLLGGHRLRFDDPFVAARLQDAQDHLAGLFAVVGEMDVAAARLDAVFQRFQMLVELGQRGVFDRAGLVAHLAGIGELVPSQPVAAGKVAELHQNPLQVLIGQRRVRGGQKLVMLAANVVGLHAEYHAESRLGAQGRLAVAHRVDRPPALARGAD